MKKILVPTDFSAAAENALVFALAIAKSQEADILLIHTYRLPLDYHIPPTLIDRMELDEQAHVSMALDSYLEVIRVKYDCQGVDIAKLPVQGFTSDAIVQTAIDEAVDMIVMGTKGASGLVEVLIGSMTASVTGLATCPVLAVPDGAKFNGFDQIIYASDFSPSDYGTIHQLIAFGKLFKAKTTCLHITDKEDFFIDDVAFSLMQEQYGNAFPKDKVEFKVLLSKNLSQGMEEAIEQYQASLVAMATRKRGFIDGLFSPSQSKKMALHTKVPLLVFQA